MTLRLLCVAIALAAVSSAAADDLDEVLHGLSARHHGEANFVEQQFLSILKRPRESWGKLIYDAPDRLEKRTLEPHPESLLVNGDVLTVERGHRTHVVALTAYPQLLPFIESIRATLAGDKAALERVFHLQFSGTTTRWTLDLSPLDTKVAQTIAAVRIDGAADNLLQVEIRQADGDRSLMTLQALVGR